MVTADRPDYVRRAIASFRAQTHPNCELVVLDNGQHPMEHLLAELPPERVVYRHVDKTPDTHIGALRNQSLEMARGAFVAPQWDDDDWSHPTRIARQLAVLQSGYDACTLPGTLMHVDSPELFEHPFIGLLPRGVPPTLLHRRDDAIRYPNLRRTSDTTYVEQWERRRYAILPRGSEGLYVRYFHGGNLWEQEHFVRRMRNTPRDLLAFLWARYVRRDVRTHPRFRLSSETREAFRLYLEQSRPFGFFQADPQA
jgi:glycosyltransferase involved in cell wall biosynthesis